MKRKLIQTTQSDLIVCDNPECDFKIPNRDPVIQVEDMDLRPYLNMPCPKCGENLLTEKDYIDSEKLISFIKKVNKYFSWLAYLFPSKRPINTQVKVHNGIHIKEK